MAKMKRKFCNEITFLGTVRGRALTATGRNKREAEKRLRNLFAQQGQPTIVRNPGENSLDLAYTDLLTIEPTAEAA